jgi:methylglutaconyl-CoA hydratase
MDFRTLLYRVDNRLATLTLNRPEKLNALDDPTIRDLSAAFASASKDPAVKIVVLRGAGPVFCAGRDPDLLKRLLQASLEDQQADAQRLAGLFRTIHDLRKPVLAVVEGQALSEGVGVAAACDIVLAAEEAQFGLPDVRSGAIPAIPLVFIAKRVGEARARELALRGQPLSATDAFTIGLVNVVVPRARIDAALARLASSLVSDNSGNAMALTKELLSRVMGMNLAEALDFATNMHAASRMTAECRKGMTATLNGETPEW